MTNLPEVITLKRLADLPQGVGFLSTSSLHTSEEAAAWAHDFGASEVYTFRQSTGGLLAWIVTKVKKNESSSSL